MVQHESQWPDQQHMNTAHSKKMNRLIITTCGNSLRYFSSPEQSLNVSVLILCNDTP